VAKADAQGLDVLLLSEKGNPPVAQLVNFRKLQKQKEAKDKKVCGSRLFCSCPKPPIPDV
jgi:translation initiation factor IF-3